MELKQLKYFYVVAKYESFTLASQELNISQPALSKTISNLEQELGFKLFDRNNNGITLNNYGISFFNIVKKVFLTLEDGIQSIQDQDDPDTGTVSFAVSETIMLDEFIYHFLLSHPKSSVYHYVCNTHDMLDGLLNSKFDFAISTEKLPSNKITWTFLFHDILTVLLPSSHPLANKSEISLEDLKDETFTTGHISFGETSILEKLFSNTDKTPKILYEGNSVEMTGKLVSKGLTVSLAPVSASLANSIYGKMSNTVSVVPLANSNYFSMDIGISYLKGHHQSKLASIFLSELIAYYNKLEHLSMQLH